ncbi:S8 family peptidase [Bacillus velezensis]|uniref:S8 family peptidase n=1 Tax=Bacillus velezensis TaxID=492670 RepID=UPI000D017B30|nr:S8 family peptidase [Bacillus velezensis]AVM08596.1 serine protease [Bacillus velezensis]QDF48704.1 alkaline serine protease [Bacillus velezensis]QDF52350.1 alkaline serine protease [Bacillus velezensis]
MFGYSMVQMVRSNAHKLDWPLRENVLQLYKPFKWTPCFLHKFFEKKVKNRKKMSVIIEFEEGCHESGFHSTGQVLSKEKRCTIKKQFQTINCCSAEVTPSALHMLLSQCRDIRKIYLNREVKALLDTAAESSHAKEVTRNGTVLTGKGVTVAVIDTGIYQHPDLAGRVIGFADFVNQKTEPYDDNGHGTHCAGDIASSGASSSGKYQGPAPEADLIGVKVLNKSGSGTLADIIEGVEWCIQYNKEHTKNPIRIISMSLGGDALRYDKETDDPLVKAVEEAWNEGIVVCVAAGNSGPEAQTISSPGVSEKVITVGAYDDNDTAGNEDDTVASFSSRGPTVYGKEKPDILAPGVDIVSLRSPRSYLDKLQKSNRVGSLYFSLSGTSMATPICAGIAALILQQNPQLSPDEVKTLIKQSPDQWTNEDPNIYGAGAVNAENAVPKE